MRILPALARPAWPGPGRGGVSPRGLSPVGLRAASAAPPGESPLPGTAHVPQPSSGAPSSRKPHKARPAHRVSPTESRGEQHGPVRRAGPGQPCGVTSLWRQAVGSAPLPLRGRVSSRCRGSKGPPPGRCAAAGQSWGGVAGHGWPGVFPLSPGAQAGPPAQAAAGAPLVSSLSSAGAPSPSKSMCLWQQAESQVGQWGLRPRLSLVGEGQEGPAHPATRVPPPLCGRAAHGPGAGTQGRRAGLAMCF